MILHRMIVLACAAACTVALSACQRPPSELDTAKIELALKGKGELDKKEGVFRVAVPRRDLKVTVSSVPVIPSIGLTSWASFISTDEGVLAMGSVVLTEDQVTPVMDSALAGGLEVTGLHNHFAFDTPRLVFLYFRGVGPQDRVVAAVGKVFETIRQTSTPDDQSAKIYVEPPVTSMDTQRLEAILGYQGQLTDGTFRVVIGRKVRLANQAVGKLMGVNTWVTFVGTDARAVVDGDFVAAQKELAAVIKALRAGGINVVAIHTRMTLESPRLVFLHFWGVGKATELATALRAALNAQRPSTWMRQALVGDDQ